MIQENQKRFEELLEEMKQLFPDTTVYVRLIITADSIKLVEQFRHPELLKKSMISMRNIKGDFIKT